MKIRKFKMKISLEIWFLSIKCIVLGMKKFSISKLHDFIFIHFVKFKLFNRVEDDSVMSSKIAHLTIKAKIILMISYEFIDEETFEQE